jgi:Skp family chaperone for outer membrane proteins
MKPLKMMMAIAAVSVLGVASGFAQAAPTQQPTAKPPATQPPATPPAAPPAAAAPAPAARPPAPFPEGAKIAFVNINQIAGGSVEGKAATGKIQEWEKKKNSELLGKGTALKAMQDKLSSGGGVMSDPARSQLEKDIEKAQRELQFAQQDAQTERNEMTQQLQGEFQEKLNPVIEALRVEKGLQIIFSVLDAGIVAADPGLDLSAEVIKRFDAASKTPPKK